MGDKAEPDSTLTHVDSLRNIKYLYFTLLYMGSLGGPILIREALFPSHLIQPLLPFFADIR